MKEWFVFYTQYNHEKKVHVELLKSGNESYLPVIRSIKQWSDRKKKVETPMFPCYNFVRCKESEIYSILTFNGIVKAIKVGDKFARISENELAIIKRVVEHPDEVQILTENFEKGERVKIQSGCFTGQYGEIIRIKGEGRQLVLLLELLGTKVVTTITSPIA
jgi:transcription antitermination factor NusG